MRSYIVYNCKELRADCASPWLHRDAKYGCIWPGWLSLTPVKPVTVWITQFQSEPYCKERKSTLPILFDNITSSHPMVILSVVHALMPCSFMPQTVLARPREFNGRQARRHSGLVNPRQIYWHQWAVVFCFLFDP